MKAIVALCILALVGYSVAETKKYPRGCIFVMGRCARECEVGTHSYNTGCSRKMPEATCDNPNPELEEGILCDYSACYCDAPTVRDTASGKCVRLEDCPQNCQD
ncbi:hypothetical protein ACJJTC_018191 [Scirpophaga incertulas]